MTINEKALEKAAKAAREENARQYRDNDREKVRNKCGIPFWEEEIRPYLIAEAVINAYEASLWRPIEEAPSQEAVIILTEDDRISVGQHYKQEWFDCLEDNMEVNPTHWRPMPYFKE